MIDQLLENVKGGAMGDIMSKFGLDEGKAKGIMDLAGGSTKEVMTEKVKSGGLDTVMNLFSNKENGSSENGVMSSVQDNFVTKITSQLGIDPSIAKNIADTVLPKITSMITSKNEETPSSDSSSILSMFGGDSMDSLKDTAMDKLKGLF
jgi:uncharacterized protein YidB (DUF937 family)